MDEDRRDDSPGRRETDSPKRLNDWRDPRFIVQMLMLLGAIFSFYLLSERRTTTLEIAASNLNDKAARIEGQLGAIVASVQTVTNATTKHQAELDAMKERLRQAEEALTTLQRDYTYNLSTRLARLESSKGSKGE